MSDVADDVVTARLDQVHGADIATGVTMAMATRPSMPGRFCIATRTVKAITGARRDCGHSSLLPSPGERSQLDAAPARWRGTRTPVDEGSFMARGGWDFGGSHVVEHARPIETPWRACVRSNDLGVPRSPGRKKDSRGNQDLNT